LRKALTRFARRAAWARGPSLVGVAVHDALFILLILAVLGLLALRAKGAERL
jgi:hypothetical protein